MSDELLIKLKELCDNWFLDDIKYRGGECLYCLSVKGHSKGCPTYIYI